MSQTQPQQSFEEDPPRTPAGEEERDPSEALLLNIDGYEGPIDVLLVMARDQKVDLTKISILQLVRQYLAFIDRAAAMRLDLAAEYLVMAAWLAYLKSRLLLPKQDNEDGVDAAAMAEALQYQLRRLEAMQKAAEDMFALPQLGQDIFGRGMPEGLAVALDTVSDVSLIDMLKAYGDIKKRQEKTEAYELPVFNLMSMEAALERMTRMLGSLPKKGMQSVWTTLHSFLPEDMKDRLFGRSALASYFTAGLELVKQGRLEIRQDGAFRPIYLRTTSAGD
jgi:segregation and condensation protein A